MSWCFGTVLLEDVMSLLSSGSLQPNPTHHHVQVDERLGALQDLESRLKQSQLQADVFTNRERIFDLPASPLPALAGL